MKIKEEPSDFYYDKSPMNKPAVKLLNTETDKHRPHQTHQGFYNRGRGVGFSSNEFYDVPPPPPPPPRATHQQHNHQNEDVKPFYNQRPGMGFGNYSSPPPPPPVPQGEHH